MGRSKIIFGSEVLMDLTGDTVIKEKLLRGTTAHGADGEPIEGTCDYDVDSSGATATQAEVLVGKSFAKGGKVLDGEMPNIGGEDVTISSKDEEGQIKQGYHDGSGKAMIASTEKAKLIPANIREGVTILGVIGTMSGTESVKAQAREATPQTTEQVIVPEDGFNYLSQVTIKAIPYVESDNAAGGKTVTIG